MSIKNDGDLLLTKARPVINMCMFVVFSAFVSFHCTFSSSVSPFTTARGYTVFSVSFREERSHSGEIFSMISSPEIAAASSGYLHFQSLLNYRKLCFQSRFNSLYVRASI